MTVTVEHPATAEARRDELAGRLMGAALGRARAAGHLPGRPARALPRPRWTTARRPRPSWPSGPASIRATRASGSSIRRSGRSSTSTTSAPLPTRAATRCRPATPRSSSTLTARGWSPRIAQFVVGTRAARCPPCSTRTGRATAWTGPTTAPTSSRPRRRSTGRSSRTSSATGSALCRTSPRGCARATAVSPTSPAGPAGRRSRSPAPSRESSVDGIDIDAGSIERAEGTAEREGVTDRVSFLFADAADGRRARALRPRDDLRGRARHGPAGRGARHGSRAADARRRGPHRRRARGRVIHRARRRGRAALLRLQRRRLPGRTGWPSSHRSGRAPSSGRPPSRRSPREAGFAGFTILPIEHDASASTASTRNPAAACESRPAQGCSRRRTVVDALDTRCYPRPQVAAGLREAAHDRPRRSSRPSQRAVSRRSVRR